MRLLILVVFGAVGTLARYGMEGAVQDRSGSGFPFGTLTVNLLGCFFLGLAGRFALNHISIPPNWRIGLTTGFFGAFTTFSTFSWDAAHMLEDGEWTRALLYVGASVILGLALMLVGMRTGDAL